MPHQRFNTRRRFLQRSVAATAGLATSNLLSNPPANKLNFAHIGVGGQGGAGFGVSAGHNVVAICDVNERELHKKNKNVPDGAPRFTDYRRMFDKLGKQIDAVVIATPDHQHALPALMAIRGGMHVYCEKPLAHTVEECFLLAQATREAGVKTQMGNQAHGDWQFHRAAELIEAGFIGEVTEVHVNGCHPAETAWHDNGPPTIGDRRPPPGDTAVPEGLHWDTWLGGAADRPYHPTYTPKGWRGWRDFGTGGLGDFFCHHADPAFMALGLRQPVLVEACVHKPERAHVADRNPGATVRYRFPARGTRPPVTI